MFKYKQIPNFLKRDEESLIFNQDGEMVYYVPEVYFERKYASIVGNSVTLIGIFNYQIFDNKGKSSGVKTFNFPTLFVCQPYEIEKVKDFQLTKNDDKNDYRLLKFRKGNKAVVSVKVAQDVENAELFYKMFTTGKLPTTIDYDKIQNYFIENISLNGAGYGLNLQIFGIIISEMCRAKNDETKLFRHTDIKNMTDYKYINIKQIPKLVSPFTSITSENWDEATVNAITNKNTKYSPLEKLFML